MKKKIKQIVLVISFILLAALSVRVLYGVIRWKDTSGDYDSSIEEEAENLGLRTVNGLDMLIYQGAKALEIWTGKYPDVKDMKIAALQAL